MASGDGLSVGFVRAPRAGAVEMDGARSHLVAGAFFEMPDRAVADNVGADIGDRTALNADNVVVGGAVDIETGAVFAGDGGESVLCHQGHQRPVDRGEGHVRELRPDQFVDIGCCRVQAAQSVQRIHHRVALGGPSCAGAGRGSRGKLRVHDGKCTNSWMESCGAGRSAGNRKIRWIRL